MKGWLNFSSLKGWFNGSLLHLGTLRLILNTFFNVKRLLHEPFGEALLCRTKKVLAKQHLVSKGNSLSRKKRIETISHLYVQYTEFMGLKQCLCGPFNLKSISYSHLVKILLCYRLCILKCDINYEYKRRL